MYVIRNQQNKAVLYVNPAPLQQQLSPIEIYHDYDPETMEILTSDLSELPEHYNVNANNEIVPLTLEEQIAFGHITLGLTQKLQDGQVVEKPLAEQVAEGLIVLDSTQKIEDDQIVQKPLVEQVAEGLLILNEPFQHIENEEIRYRSLEELLDENLITTIDQCNEALELLYREIEEAIEEKYSMGAELKITKAYIAWTNEGKPASDERETTFLTMQQTVNTIKADFATTKDQLKALLVQLQSNA